MRARWGSLEELSRATRAYEAEWWRTDEAAQTLLRNRFTPSRVRTQILELATTKRFVSTRHVYGRGEGDARHYVDERRQLHDRIVAQCLPDPLPAPRRDPHVYFTIGCPGAGKSTILRNIVERRRDAEQRDDPYLTIDADQVRQLLPEYASGRGSHVVQSECFDITYGPLLDAVIDQRADIVFDTIGRKESIDETLRDLLSNGYSVHMLEAYAPISTCQERTDSRALALDGRLVDPGLVEDAAGEAAAVLRGLHAEEFPFAGWARIDTSRPSEPRLTSGTQDWAAHVSDR